MLHTFPKLHHKFKCKKDKNGNIVTDIGITKWNLRPRKNVHSKYLTTIHLDTLDIPLKEYMSPLEQSKYKYILHLSQGTAPRVSDSQPCRVRHQHHLWVT